MVISWPLGCPRFHLVGPDSTNREIHSPEDDKRPPPRHHKGIWTRSLHLLMTKRDNHYEAAFEAYLQQRRIPYVAVDETRRSAAVGVTTADPDEAATLKSLDFIVSPG